MAGLLGTSEQSKSWVERRYHHPTTLPIPIYHPHFPQGREEEKPSIRSTKTTPSRFGYGFQLGLKHPASC